MSEWNYDVFKKNVNTLIRNNHITQAQLSEAIGITQSNLSKNLSEFNTSRFNIEQIVKLAEYFKISVDELLGIKPKSEINLTLRETCTFIANILKAGFNAYLMPISVNEMCSGDYDNFGRIMFSESDNRYFAIYFPNFYDLSTEENYCKTTTEREVLSDEYHQVGNDLPKNKKINTFIEKIEPIIELYKKHQLSDEVYNVVLNNFLDDLDK